MQIITDLSGRQRFLNGSSIQHLSWLWTHTLEHFPWQTQRHRCEALRMLPPQAHWSFWAMELKNCFSFGPTSFFNRPYLLLFTALDLTKMYSCPRPRSIYPWGQIKVTFALAKLCSREKRDSREEPPYMPSSLVTSGLRGTINILTNVPHASLEAITLGDLIVTGRERPWILFLWMFLQDIWWQEWRSFPKQLDMRPRE